MSRSVLAAAGILFILILIAAIAYLIFKLIKSDANSTPQRAAPPVLDDPLTILRGRYDSVAAALEIPQNAMVVRLVCNHYTAGTALRHHCWIKDGALTIFPLWESLAGTVSTHDLRDVQPREWRIPVSDIVCFATEQGLPDRFVVLQFKRDSEVLTLAFSEDAAKVFSILFPEKDFTHLLEELYPKSSRNIRDIKEGFLSLKELREEDLITEDEYNAKKKEMLILM